ncbi:Ig-like domain-containing protein, partial [Undibacterium fentianense]
MNTELHTLTSHNSNVIQLAVIDTRLKDYQQIAAALPNDVQIIYINGQSNGIQDILNVLPAQIQISTLHIYSHASNADLQLGSEHLTLTNITSDSQQAALHHLGQTLTTDGLIVLYGCDLAKLESGTQLVQEFALSTGATVAASTDTTGPSSLNGDWNMELVANSDGQIIASTSDAYTLVQDRTLAINAYESKLGSLIDGSNQVFLSSGSDYIDTRAPGTKPMAMLGAVKLSSGERVVLHANMVADYFGTPNLDYLSVSIVNSQGDVNTISLSGTVANVVNNNDGQTHNQSVTQTNDSASIIALKNGGFVVASQSRSGYGLQLFNSNGESQNTTAPLWINSYSPSSRLLADADGGFVILWTETASSNETVAVLFQRYAADGSTIGSAVSKVYASGTPIVEQAAIDENGMIAIPISSADVFTPSQVALWNNSNQLVGTYDTAFFQSAAVIAPMFGGGFDLFGKDLTSGVGNTANSYFVQTLGADGSLGLTVDTGIQANLIRTIATDTSGNYFAVGGANATSNSAYFIDGFKPSAVTSSQLIDDANQLVTIPSLHSDHSATGVWISDSYKNQNDLIVSGTVEVVDYTAVFSTPQDYPPTLSGTFTTNGALTDQASIQPFKNLSVSDVDSISGRVRITYNAANGSLSGEGITGTPGNYTLDTTTTDFSTLSKDLQSLVFYPTQNQVIVGNTVQTIFTITPNDGPRDGRANTATKITATSINDAPRIDNNKSAATANLYSDENQTKIATISATDVDVGQTLTYSISGTDASFFNIDTSTGDLTFISAPNFEERLDGDKSNSYDVIVKVSDGSASDQQAITVYITDVNEDPVITSNGGGATAKVSAAENQTSITKVVASDVDANTTLTYSIAGTDASFFDINSSDGTLTFKNAPDFESPADKGKDNVYDITVTVSDGTLTDNQDIAITVTNANDAPVITGLTSADNQSVLASAAAVLIDQAVLAVVSDIDNANLDGGYLSIAIASGRQTGDTLGIRANADLSLSNQTAVGSTITIEGQIIGSIANNGTGTGSDSLIINLNAQATPARVSTLLQNISFDATGVKGDRVINIQVNDGAASSAAAELTVSVATNPTVEISSSSNTLKAGETATITFTFSASPIGFDADDITVSGGVLSNLAVNGQDDKIYTATFTPNDDTQSLTGAISIAAEKFKNALDEDNLASVTNANISADTKLPTVSSLVRADSNPSNADSVDFTLTFSESVTGVDIADFSLTNTGAAAGTVTAVSGSGNSYTITVSGLTGEGSLRLDLNNSGTSINDLGGNLLNKGYTAGESYTFDRTVPSLTSITRADADNTNASSLSFTLKFSESVSGLDLDDLTLSKTGDADGDIASISGSGDTYTVTINNLSGTGTLRLDLNGSGTAISDTASNLVSGAYTAGEFYTIDRHAPTISSITPTGDKATNSESSSFKVTFSEDVNGVDLSDFSLNTTGNASGSLASITGKGNEYTIVIDHLTGAGDIRIDLNKNATQISDIVGNQITTGYTSGNVLTIDRVAPTLSQSIDMSDTKLSIGETATVTWVFSEEVKDFTTDDLTADNGVISNLESKDGITWHATFTPSKEISDTSNLITLAMSGIADVMGNYGSGKESSPNYEIDNVRPALAAEISLSDSLLNAGETATVTFTFTEAVTDFTTDDITSQNGSISNLTSTDKGVTWTATLSPNESKSDTSGVLSLDLSGLTDLAGNAGVGSIESGKYSTDTSAPGLASMISVSDTALKIGETATVTFSFTEKVTAFTTDDIQSKNGSISKLESSDDGLTWTAVFTPTDNVENSANAITLDMSTITDLAGNKGSGTADSENFSIDTRRPTSTISIDNSALKIGDTATVTMTFSEPITDLTAANFTVPNGGLSNFSTKDSGITWTASYTPADDIEDSTNSISLNLSGIIDSAGNAGTGSKDTTNFVIDTKSPTATISLVDTQLTVGESTLVTITFSEAITGLDGSDLQVPNGNLSALSSKDGGVTWLATYTPNFGVADDSNKIILDYAGVMDSHGNSGKGNAQSNNFTINTVNTAPEISGTSAGLRLTDISTIAPFSNIVIVDNDPDAKETASVTLDTAAKGTFTVASLALSGFSTNDGGLTYVHSAASPAQIQAALRSLVFQPTTGRVAIGSTETTQFSVTIHDGVAGDTDSLTSVIATAVNGAPTKIDLSSTRVSQSAGANALVGTFNTTDMNPGDTHQYAFVVGSDNSQLFSIVGNALHVKDPEQLSAGDYEITVRSTDAGGLSVTNTLTVRVRDSFPPEIDAFEVAQDSANPDQALYTLQFSEDVKGVDASDFILSKSGDINARISGITQVNPSTYQIKISGIEGNGQLQLDLRSEHGITDLSDRLLIGGSQGPALSIGSDQTPIFDWLEANVPNREGEGTGDGNGDGIQDIEQDAVSSLIWSQQDDIDPTYLTVWNDQNL